MKFLLESTGDDLIYLDNLENKEEDQEQQALS